MIQIGDILDGRYEVLKKIGQGGMSVVYMAVDSHVENRMWAIKEVRKNGTGENDEKFVNSLMTEANMIKKLDHPALPRIVDIIDTKETYCIIMDYIEGQSLDHVLKEFGAQSEEDVLLWSKQICDVFSYLHSQTPPIIYRDMKPANVMLKPDGNIKIIDFGIAREYKEESLADTAVLGTKGYAPPEQYSGQTDARSDIFALGMTMHHLLTGVDPRGGTVYAPVRQYNPELSEGIEIIIDKCVDPVPENRYQNCADLMYDLNHPNLITKGYKKQQKRKLALFILLTALCVVMLISGIVCNRASVSINNNDYEVLINVASSTPVDSKIDSYKKAIEIYPYDVRAYEKILEAYENEGKFSLNESKQFLAVYNKNKDGFDISSPGVAELNYKAGTMYFTYYTNEDGSTSISERIQKAYGFFEANQNVGISFSHKALSECYYQICLFYKNYILSSASVIEASKDDYINLLNSVENTIDGISNSSNASAYDKLTLCNAAFRLIVDQKKEMATLKVPKETVYNLIDIIYDETSVDKISVRKEQSKALQDEIQSNYSSVKESIEITYSNTEERS